MAEREPPPDSDVRRPFRMVVDVLATEAQVIELQALLGETVCGASHEHPGPCRIAWTMSYSGDDPDGSYGLDAEEAAFVREQLAPVPVWPTADVDNSLGL
ncbi:hypothetical protein [Cryptosporangium japonicum]|uniref:Uncharacterized protein n=1 Tax=Cryptosporangium japonicum TaxID=80872 RepID=A0ABN0UEX4_9ACTN